MKICPWRMSLIAKQFNKIFIEVKPSKLFAAANVPNYSSSLESYNCESYLYTFFVCEHEFFCPRLLRHGKCNAKLFF